LRAEGEFWQAKNAKNFCFKSDVFIVGYFL